MSDNSYRDELVKTIMMPQKCPDNFNLKKNSRRHGARFGTVTCCHHFPVLDSTKDGLLNFKITCEIVV